jgi:hypothetical protein
MSVKDVYASDLLLREVEDISICPLLIVFSRLKTKCFCNLFNINLKSLRTSLGRLRSSAKRTSRERIRLKSVFSLSVNTRCSTVNVGEL